MRISVFNFFCFCYHIFIFVHFVNVSSCGHNILLIYNHSFCIFSLAFFATNSFECVSVCCALAINSGSIFTDKLEIARSFLASIIVLYSRPVINKLWAAAQLRNHLYFLMGHTQFAVMDRWECKTKYHKLRKLEFFIVSYPLKE